LGLGNAAKRDSQDICFAPDGDYAGFIKKRAGVLPEKGRFRDMAGNDLGEHRGLIHYTIGQRKGLGLAAAAPLYVCDIRPENNTVVLGRGENLYAKTLTAGDLNLIPLEKIDAPLRLWAKVRYRQAEQPATVWQVDADTLRVEFDSPQRAIARGQAVVLSDGDVVVGGGTINGILGSQGRRTQE
jgi:tRNA-specific 2-thiouridylase